MVPSGAVTTPSGRCNSAAVAAHQHMVFQSHNYLSGSAKKLSSPGIQRLGETRVDNGYVKALGC